MAFNTNPGKQSFSATAAQEDFVFNFKIYTASDLKVYITPTGDDPDDTADLLTLTTDYTVTIDGDSGGTVSLVTGATLNDTVVIQRVLPVTRTTSYVTNGDMIAETLNTDQEYQTYMILDGFTNLDTNYIWLPTTDINMDNQLPTSVAGQALFVKNDGTGFEYRAADENGAALEAWESQAHAFTSESFATEPEDTFAKEFTSNGDGTFTDTPTTKYSALHWAAKAATFNPALYATLAGAAFTGGITGTTADFTGIVDVGTLEIGGVEVTASPAELNQLDGLTLISGTFTPTVTTGTGVSGTSSPKGIYSRVGDIVNVSVKLDVAFTSGYGDIYIDPPIASVFDDAHGDVVGNAIGVVDADVMGQAYALTSTDKIRVGMTPVTTGSRMVAITLQYVIK